VSEPSDVANFRGWASPTEAHTPRTVCAVAKRTAEPFAIGSVADADTRSCVRAPFTSASGVRPSRFAPGERGWPPVHVTVGREMDRRAAMLERQAPLIEGALRRQEERRLRHEARLLEKTQPNSV
jgi:hypothetical protein